VTNNKMTAAERKALKLLTGCPTGATWPALESRGITQAALDGLVERGLITGHLQRFSNPPGLTVVRYWLVRADGRGCGR
jgi:hypothetical protein